MPDKVSVEEEPGGPAWFGHHSCKFNSNCESHFDGGTKTGATIELSIGITANLIASNGRVLIEPGHLFWKPNM